MLPPDLNASKNIGNHTNILTEDLTCKKNASGKFSTFSMSDLSAIPGTVTGKVMIN